MDDNRVRETLLDLNSIGHRPSDGARTPDLENAIHQFLDDLEARNLARATLRTYSATLGSFSNFVTGEGLQTVIEVTPDVLRDWRNSLIRTHQPSTQVRMLTQIKAFARYLVERNWLLSSPASALRPPRYERKPTLPFDIEEMRKILRVCESTPDSRALVLLMRYSGLAIGDACTLRKDAVSDGILFLHRAKTGEPVTVPVPDCVNQALSAFPSVSEEHFFWTGKCLKETVTKRWGARLKLKFRAAGITGGRPHRFRDTFAVELLKAGTSMEDVSVLLGHSSIRVTEQYYAPWCPRRRERLNSIVMRAWSHDPLLVELHTQT